MAYSSLFGKEYKHERYRCSYCGLEAQGKPFGGKPNPGFCTTRGKDSNGRIKPHVWVKS